MLTEASCYLSSVPELVVRLRLLQLLARVDVRPFVCGVIFQGLLSPLVRAWEPREDTRAVKQSFRRQACRGGKRTDPPRCRTSGCRSRSCPSAPGAPPAPPGRRRPPPPTSSRCAGPAAPPAEPTAGLRRRRGGFSLKKGLVCPADAGSLARLDPPNRSQGDSWLSAATFGSLRRESKSFRRTSMKDCSIARPASVPGTAHSVSPTVRSTFRDASVSCQSTGCEAEERGGGQTEVTPEGDSSAGELGPCSPEHKCP